MVERIQIMRMYLANLKYTIKESIKRKWIPFRDNWVYVKFPFIEEFFEKRKGRVKSYYSQRKKRWMYETKNEEENFPEVIKTVELTKEEKQKIHSDFQEGKSFCLFQEWKKKNSL